MAVAVVIGVVALGGLVEASTPDAGAGSSGTDDEAVRAASEISQARQRANQLADQLWSAQSDLEVLRSEASEIEAQVARLVDQTERLARVLESVAVNRFVAAGTAGIPLLSDVMSPNERVLTDFYTDVVHDIGDADRDEYRRLSLELEEATARLDTNTAQQQATIASLESLRVQAENDVTRLRELERQRLEDEAVQRALEAQRREQERRERAREQSASDALVAQVAASGAPAGITPGGAGAGNQPQAATFVDQMACPIRGASAYSDTWGAPRSGGRRHQGVDMLAPVGTPLQAVVSGHVEHRNFSLGGLSIILRGDNGNRYFYAHLSAYEGGPGRYSQGDVIGYVGDTGNAYGTPHLHFEIRPGGGVQVNPTPSVRSAGC